MILLDRVSKTYNRRGPALERISLHVEPKEFVIIVGPSGAGKSTLFKLLTREEKPTSGKIIVGGIDYERLKEKDVPLLRRKIAGISNAEIKHTVPKVLDVVGLKGKENNYPMELSGGERQRVAIARAIVRQPKILIAD